MPLAWSRLSESYGPGGRLDLPGLGLVSAGLFGIVWGLVRGNEQGWASPEIVFALSAGRRAGRGVRALGAAHRAPMLPMRFFRNAPSRWRTSRRCFMFFGMFGSIFLLSQFFQTVQGYSPFGSGLRILPWTLAPMFIAPIAGAHVGQDLAEGDHRHRARAAGGRARLDGPRHDADTPYSDLVAPFIIAGVGMALFFAPMANVVLSRRPAARRRARPPAPTTRSASSAASSASPSSRRSSPTWAGTAAADRSSTA